MTSNDLTHADLKILLEQGRWHDIVTATDALSDWQRSQPGFSFYRGMAMTRSGRADEAIAVIRAGLSIEPKSRWGRKLLFDAYRTNNQLTEAFEGFAEFIDSADGYESEKDWYIQWAAEFGLFDIASAMNEKRQVIRDVPAVPRFALGLQCFCKPDTLEEVFSSLLALANAKTYSLVILQDSPLGSPKADRYADGCARVKEAISRWQQQLASTFFSVEYFENERNLGTAPTCRRLVDYVTKKFDGFLFIEDDCILAPSALDWITHHLDKSISLDGPCWFVTCESSCFDKEERELSDELRTRLSVVAGSELLKHSYSFHDFVNSTCFATKSEVWAVCGNIRSFTRGPESLNRYVVSRGIKTIAPIVPRAADIGMMHEMGYSMMTGGAANIRERKSIYLLNKDPFRAELCKPFEGDRDLVYAATSKLNLESVNRLEQVLAPKEGKKD